MLVDNLPMKRSEGGGSRKWPRCSALSAEPCELRAEEMSDFSLVSVHFGGKQHENDR